MSIVGPRPEQVELVQRYRPEHRFRLSVKPGITGPMQVFGRGDLQMNEPGTPATSDVASMAVEMWVKRDHAAEWSRWSGWLDHIAQRVSAIDGIQTSVVQPEGLSNKTPSLKGLWDRARLGASGETVARTLLDGEPRIALFPARSDDETKTGSLDQPYMLSPGEEKIVADRLYEVLSNPPKEAAPTPAAPATDVTGRWDVRIEYAAAVSDHTLHLRQRGKDIDGTHQGDFVAGSRWASSTVTA